MQSLAYNPINSINVYPLFHTPINSCYLCLLDDSLLTDISMLALTN